MAKLFTHMSGKRALVLCVAVVAAAVSAKGGFHFSPDGFFQGGG